MKSVNQKLIEKAGQLTNPVQTKYMQAENLHCTAHVHKGGPDVPYEAEWFKMLEKPSVHWNSS